MVISGGLSWAMVRHGMNTAEGYYEAVGSGHTTITWTSLGDIGKVIALVKDAPNELRLARTSKSLREVAHLMQTEDVDKRKIDLRIVDGKAFREESISRDRPSSI